MFKPGCYQNDTFEEEMGGRELSFQNGSLPFKTGELEHMSLWISMLWYSVFSKA